MNQPVAIRKDPKLDAFRANLQKLASLPVTVTSAHIAKEVMDEATIWLSAFRHEHEPTKKKLYDAHRDFSKWMNEHSAPAEAVIQTAKRIIGAWERKRQEAERARIAMERQIAIEAQKREREATVNELLDEGRIDEAIEIEEAPVMPVIVRTEPEAGKVADTAATRRLVGSVTNLTVLLRQLADKPELAADLIEVRQGALNRALNRGIKLDGVEVCEDVSIRNLRVSNG